MKKLAFLPKSVMYKFEAKGVEFAEDIRTIIEISSILKGDEKKDFLR